MLGKQADNMADNDSLRVWAWRAMQPVSTHGNGIKISFLPVVQLSVRLTATFDVWEQKHYY